jgi:5-methylthioadenosine/S-adenosylhomocysteine deaminase
VIETPSVTIVRAELVFAEDRWVRRWAFAMQGGIVVATGSPKELAERLPDHETEDWGNVAVLPGTVNGHAHSFQTLLRGFGDDLTFAQWRDRVLYPFSERLDGRGIHAGALLDFAEMLKAAAQVGIRVVLARAMYDWTGAPSRYQESAADSVRRFHELDAGLRGNRRAFAQPAPHSLHAASPEMIQAGVDISERLGIPFHIHVAEGSYERAMIMERHGMSPVAFLDSLGALTARAILVHCVWCDDDDLSLIAERGARIVHNPGANAFLGDGVAPFRKMLERNIRTCLGTDGGCTNSRQSIFDDMRTAALLQKAVHADASVVRAEDTLIAGTARGGEVLGLPVGRIAADHAADLVVLNLDALSLQPRATAEKQVVYAMQPDAIVRVVVGGETVVERGRLTRFDEAEIIAMVRAATSGWSRPS